MNPYIGHGTQFFGIEEHRLVGGKGDGMRLLLVRNGLGLEMTVSLDRAADISRLSFEGMNMNYFSPCGYVAPAYYDSAGTGWLNSFTAGFLTTCGLEAVGSSCRDMGQDLPMHGSIGNHPAEQICYGQEDDWLVIQGVITDETIFVRKLRLLRTLRISLKENVFEIDDTVENTGSKTEPVEILYHMNVGYPLLDEDSVLTIPAVHTTGRDAHAEEEIDNWMHMDKPDAAYMERCYYHMLSEGKVSIYQPKRQKGLVIQFNQDTLDQFVEWKMMGVRDYVLGLECGNCLPDGRDVMRKKGILKFLEPGDHCNYHIKVRCYSENGQ